MPKTHRRTNKYESDSESGSDSCDDSDMSSDYEMEKDTPICEITNEDIAQAFALFDYRLTQICKKIGVDTAETIKTPGDNEETPEEIYLGESKEETHLEESKDSVEFTTPIFPQVFRVPINMDTSTGNPKIPPAMRRLFPHK